MGLCVRVDSQMVLDGPDARGMGSGSDDCTLLAPGVDATRQRDGAVVDVDLHASGLSFSPALEGLLDCSADDVRVHIRRIYQDAVCNSAHA